MVCSTCVQVIKDLVYNKQIINCFKKMEEHISTILKGKKIIIVEDDLFIGDLLTQKIRTFDVSVERFENGEDALKAIVETVPDLVLLDLFLPRMSGFDVLGQIRSNEKTKNIKVIVVSNTDQAEDRKRVTDMGAEFVIKAMVSPETIIEYTAQMLETGKVVQTDF